MLMEENRILLVSIVGTKNFGNRLQQYALQHTIEQLGFEVDLLQRGEPTIKAIAKWVLKILWVISRNKVHKAKVERSKKFLESKDLFYKNLLFVPANRIFQTDWSKYKYAIAGSDQIWHNGSSYSYLEFIDKPKRMSYAPSFGFTSFPEKDILVHQQGLNGINALSCREQGGCDLIYELVGRKAQKTLDPTLLLTKEEWENIEKEPDFTVSEQYLLVDVLGTLLPEYDMEIRRIAKERSLEVLNISDTADIKHYAISPDEFIWLVHHADTICTDSFHASVFAILFEKNLRVFRRKQERFNDMFGRLHDLLDPLELMQLVYGEGEGLSTVLSEKAQVYLQTEREASLQYLKKSLCVE